MSWPYPVENIVAISRIFCLALKKTLFNKIIVFLVQIKEKSEKSLRMPRASFDGAGGNFDPQLRSDVAAYRRQSGLGGPGSRGGSRPPSRTGSNISLNSDDNSPGGSGIRRSSSMRTGGRQQTRPTPVGFGSSTPRKASTPIMQPSSNGTTSNGIRTVSNSSMDRTPMTARYACPLPRPNTGFA